MNAMIPNRSVKQWYVYTLERVRIHDHSFAARTLLLSLKKARTHSEIRTLSSAF